MAELLREFANHVDDGDGTNYVARIHAEERDDRVWEAWIEFHPDDGRKRVLRTGTETTQARRDAAESWAMGVEPSYLEGALLRAQERVP